MATRITKLRDKKNYTYSKALFIVVVVLITRVYRISYYRTKLYKDLRLV